MIASILNNELLQNVSTVILIAAFVLLAVYSKQQNKKIRKLQKYYTCVKPVDFLRTVDHAAPPSESNIEPCEIQNINDNLFVTERR